MITQIFREIGKGIPCMYGKSGFRSWLGKIRLKRTLACFMTAATASAVLAGGQAEAALTANCHDKRICLYGQCDTSYICELRDERGDGDDIRPPRMYGEFTFVGAWSASFDPSSGLTLHTATCYLCKSDPGAKRCKQKVMTSKDNCTPEYVKAPSYTYDIPDSEKSHSTVNRSNTPVSDAIRWTYQGSDSAGVTCTANPLAPTISERASMKCTVSLTRKGSSKCNNYIKPETLSVDYTPTKGGDDSKAITGTIHRERQRCIADETTYKCDCEVIEDSTFSLKLDWTVYDGRTVVGDGAIPGSDMSAITVGEDGGSITTSTGTGSVGESLTTAATEYNMGGGTSDGSEVDNTDPGDVNGGNIGDVLGEGGSGYNAGNDDWTSSSGGNSGSSNLDNRPNNSDYDSSEYSSGTGSESSGYGDSASGGSGSNGSGSSGSDGSGDSGSSGSSGSGGSGSSGSGGDSGYGSGDSGWAGSGNGSDPSGLTEDIFGTGGGSSGGTGSGTSGESGTSIYVDGDGSDSYGSGDTGWVDEAVNGGGYVGADGSVYDGDGNYVGNAGDLSGSTGGSLFDDLLGGLSGTNSGSEGTTGSLLDYLTGDTEASGLGTGYAIGEPVHFKGTIVDSNGDGIPDGIDMDGDGIPDVKGRAIDTDGDGIYDGLDVNGDGRIDIDFHGRGIGEKVDIDGTAVDSNGDGIADAVDIDGDGKGDMALPGKGWKVGDRIDLDGDGIADGVAVDINGDGIPDGVDTNGDGIPDEALPDRSASKSLLSRLASAVGLDSNDKTETMTPQEMYDEAKKLLLAMGYSEEDIAKGKNYDPNSAYTEPKKAWDMNRITTLLRRHQIVDSKMQPLIPEKRFGISKEVRRKTP